jgi:hypothetical protein
MIEFEKLSEIKCKEIKLNTIIYYPEVFELLCCYPYPNHKKGCPNFIKCRDLNVPYFGTLLHHGNYRYYYLIYLIFDFKQYKKLRKIENPEFFNTENRLKCVLYWQNSLKKIIKDFIENLQKQNNGFYVLGCGSGLNLSFQERVASMEAVGINVFSTMKLNRIPFEIKPINKIVLCNLLCSKKKILFLKNTIEKWIIN